MFFFAAVKQQARNMHSRPTQGNATLIPLNAN